MPEEKIKITRKELEDMYDIIPGLEDAEKYNELHRDKDSNSTVEFEEYTEDYDKNQKKEMKDNA